MDPLIERLPQALQQVSTIHARKDAIAWIIEDKAVHGLIDFNAQTVQAFRKHFRAQQNMNMDKAGQ